MRFFGLFILLVTTAARAQMTISAMGDILVHKALYEEALTHSDGFYSLFGLVKPLLDQADFSYGNLEGCIAPGTLADGSTVPDPGFAYDDRVYSGTNFTFNYHKSLLPDLQKLGVDIVSTANNHALDRSVVGVDRTIDSLRSAGLQFSGTRHVGESFDFTWTNIKGYQVGWLSCTEQLNGNSDPHDQVLKCFDDQKTIEALVQQNQGKILILLPHWGTEYAGTPDPNAKAWARRMAELGVTAIIGNHPHVLQPLEWITASNGHKTFVAYSLGNFLAWQAGVAKKASVILYLEFDKNGSLSGYYYRPTWRGGNWVAPYDSSFGPEPLDYIKSVLGPSPK